MNELKDGLPTGRLNADATMAEINCWAEEIGCDGVSQAVRRVPCGTRWIPVTDEMRKQMQGTVVSMVNITPKLAERLYAGIPSQPIELPFHVKDVEVGKDVGEQKEAKEVIVAADGHTYATVQIDTLDFVRTKVADQAVASEHESSDESSDRRHQERRMQEENSGGNVNYYCVPIDNPKRPERAPYIFEVEDLIEALNMTFHEGTVLKSLVRSCVERELGLRKVGGDYVRDAEKMEHSSKETLRIRKLRAKRGLK